MHGFWHIAILGIFWGLGVWCLWKEKRGSVALFYALVAVTATYPLAFSPGYLPANAPAANDAYLFLWDLWWVRFSLLQFSNPLYTDYLFAPHGTTLVFHGLALLQALVTLPLQALGDGLTGLTVAYAGVVLLSFWLAGWATYLLAMYVTGHRMGSIVAGLAYTLSSLHFASTVRFHALSIEWLPLYLLALLHVFENGRVRDGIWLGLAFVGAFYSSIEYAYFLVLATPILAIFELVWHADRVRSHALWWRSGVGFAAAALLTVPFWVAFFHESQLTHPTLASQAHFLAPDLLDFVLIDHRHSLLGPMVGGLRASIGLVPVPPAVAVSWSLAFLAFVGGFYALRRREPGALPWAALAIIFGLLTLGPEIRIARHELGIPTPYKLLASALPFFEQARMPMRFGAMAQLALGVLAAYGLACLTEGRRPVVRRAWTTAAIVWVAFETMRLPLEMRPVKIPEAYQRVASPPGASALLDWPLAVGESAEVDGLHQIVHQQRLVQDLPSFLPRAANETREIADGRDMRRLFRSILGSDAIRLADDDTRRALVSRTRQRMEGLGVQHVVLRRRDLPPEVYARGRENLELMQPDLSFEDEDGYLASFDGSPSEP